MSPVSPGDAGNEARAAADREPRAWVLNLDAEQELARGRHATPSRRLSALVAVQQRRLLGPLVFPGDVLVSEELLAAGGPRAERAAGLRGVAWSPTPRALELLDRAGARPPEAPGLEVLRRVNARPFAAELHRDLMADEPGLAKSVIHTEEELLAHLTGPRSRAPLGWLVRRTFGAAGRGRRRLDAGPPDAAELAWIRAGLRLGPLVVEPWVRVTRESTRSGWVGPDGSVRVSRPCFQRTTAEGAWIRTEHAEVGSLPHGDDTRLGEAAARAGAALARAGYFGPYGIDAFRYRAAPGAPERLQPLSEINARLTMDWALAMGDPTDAMLDALPPLGTGGA